MAGERCDDRCPDADFSSQMVWDSVAQGRESMGGYEEADPRLAGTAGDAGDPPSGALWQLEAGGSAELVGAGGLFPSEAGLAAAEMAVGGGLREDGGL
jgi:hypothetical protein